MNNKTSFGLGCLLGGFVAPIVLVVILFFSFGPLINLWVAWKTGSPSSWPDPTVIRREMGHKTAPKPKELVISQARYGATNSWIDVADQIRKRIKDNTISVQVSNDLGGDPLFGTLKRLEIEYILDGQKKTASIPEGGFLEIPGLKPIDTVEDLVAFVKRCPAEVGFFGKNFTTGRTVEYQPDQPACMASIVKLFTLLEVMSNVQAGKLKLADEIRIAGKTMTINETLDAMIGRSDNDATAALTALVGYDRVNTLPSELGMTGVSAQILPKPGVLEGILDQRVYGSRLVSPDSLLPQHATARGMVKYFQLLNAGELKSAEISTNVLAVLKRHPRGFVPNAPAGFAVVGKGGSLSWQRPGKTQFNMMGWDLYLRDEKMALGFCLWCEWFPAKMPEDMKAKWCFAISDGIAGVLLGNRTGKNVPPYFGQQ